MSHLLIGQVQKIKGDGNTEVPCKCLTFSMARCRRQIKVMGIQRYHAMPHLLTGQVQKENKSDWNTEVSHNVSPSHWPGAEGK